MKKSTLFLSLGLSLAATGQAVAQVMPSVSGDGADYEYYLQNAGLNNGYYATNAVGAENVVSFANTGDRLIVKLVATGAGEQVNVVPVNVEGMAFVGVTGTDAGSSVTYYATLDEAQNASWTIQQADATNGWQPAYEICPGGASQSWNLFGGITNSVVRLYNTGDQGSAWNFVPANLAALNSLRSQIQEDLDTPVPTVIGYNSNKLSTTERATLLSIIGENPYAEYSLSVAEDLLEAYNAYNNAAGEATLNFPSGYYLMHCVDEGRNPYLFNDYLREANSENLTLQAAAAGTTNNYVWRITTDGNAVTAIVNGQGTPVTAKDADGVHSYPALTIDEYLAGKQGLFFTEAINASNGGYAISDGTRHLTTWVGGGAGANDNRWNFTPVETANVYNVAVTGAEGYASLAATGEIALNGGFFLTEGAIAAADLAAGEVAGYAGTVSVDEATKTITVSYTENSGAIQAELDAAIEAANAALALTGAGYPAETSAARTTLSQAIAAAEAIETPTMETVSTVNAAVETYKADKTEIQLPEAEKTYVIKSYVAANGGNSAYIVNDGGTLKLAEAMPANEKAAQWTAEAIENGEAGHLYLASAADELYMGFKATSATAHDLDFEAGVTFGAIAIHSGTANRYLAVYGNVTAGSLGVGFDQSTTKQQNSGNATNLGWSTDFLFEEVKGGTTGIEQATTETDSKAPVYDLAGRRVMQPVKGGIYIQNGRKFIVK